MSKNIKFRIWEGGRSSGSKKIVSIFIPEKCVHKFTHVVSKDRRNNEASIFESSCGYGCYGSYEDLWKMRIGEPVDGEVCSYCSEFYPMATPNQPDGTLKCYSCRTTNAMRKMFVG